MDKELIPKMKNKSDNFTGTSIEKNQLLLYRNIGEKIYGAQKTISPFIYSTPILFLTTEQFYSFDMQLHVVVKQYNINLYLSKNRYIFFIQFCFVVYNLIINREKYLENFWESTHLFNIYKLEKILAVSIVQFI